MGKENGSKRLGRPEPPFGEDQPTIQKTHLQEMGKENGSKDGGSTATIWAIIAQSMGEDVKNFLLHSSFQSHHFGTAKPKMGRRELRETRTHQVGGPPPQKMDPWSMKSPHLTWPIIYHMSEWYVKHWISSARP